MGENNFRVCEEVQHKRVLSLRGGEGRGEGGGQKTKVYDLSGHECIRECSDDGKALKYCAQYPGVMQESQEGKRANLWGPRAHFGANKQTYR